MVRKGFELTYCVQSKLGLRVRLSWRDCPTAASFKSRDFQLQVNASKAPGALWEPREPASAHVVQTCLEGTGRALNALH